MNTVASRIRLLMAVALLGGVVMGLSGGGAVAQEATPAAGSVAPGPALDCGTVESVKVAFFGFAAANGFAQATWSGIQEAGKDYCAEVEFFDPNFDSATQVAQIQDAITTGEYQAFVVQANDGNSVVPPIEEAIAAGIKVVGEFTPVGVDYASIEPQVEGMTSYVGQSIVQNGTDLAELGKMACQQLNANPCQVAYMEGFKALPLDNARTDAVKAGLAAEPTIELVASVEGGYTQATGLTAAQDIIQANPEVQVIIGSSQACLGAIQAVDDAGLTGKVLLIGNGSPRQAITAVKEGQMYAVFLDAEATAGKIAAEVAIKAARGETVPASIDTTKIMPTVYGTKENIPADYEGQWDA